MITLFGREMQIQMNKISCKSCQNCIADKNGCRVYGDNPSISVTKCALDGFRNYKNKPNVGTWVVLNEHNEECALSDDVVREAIIQFMDKYMPHLHGVPQIVR